MWIPIDQDPPHGVELGVWIKADLGEETPFGELIATYKNTTMGEMWVQKVVGGAIINTGLRADLITHYRMLDGEPDERTERSAQGADPR